MKLTAKTVHEHPTGYRCWISRKADLISQNIKNQKQEVQRLYGKADQNNVYCKETIHVVLISFAVVWTSRF